MREREKEANPDHDKLSFENEYDHVALSLAV